ncbi:hypothetical protein C5167_026363 [Papaver somniferum]|nr:hypothetical protein C5167_026363 [Papaver somniferum]
MPKRPMPTGGGGPCGYWNHGDKGKALILGRLHLMTLLSPNGQPSKVTNDSLNLDAFRESEFTNELSYHSIYRSNWFCQRIILVRFKISLKNSYDSIILDNLF